MDKINIYAPIDGFVDKITSIDDDVFSKQLLGDGLFIKPTNNKKNIKLYSFLDESEVSLLTETGHAIYLKTNQGPVGLIHIGLDSAQYEQSTFNVHIKQQEKVCQDTLMIDFNLDFFEKNKLRTEIPIVFDPEESKTWKLNILKTGNVKQGEIIATLELNIAQNLDSQVPAIEKGDNKWLVTAKNLINFVGQNNFERVANCMTRTRFYVRNKDQVNIKKIESLDTVNGIAWSGNELQVVIGGNAYKVKDEVEKIMVQGNVGGFETKNIKPEKKTIWQKFLSAINGIIVPLMPLLISTGLISGISAILSNAGLIQAVPPENGFVTDMDLWSGIVYILANTGLALLGIFFCYSTVRYLGGDQAMAILIGLILASRYFMIAGGNSGEWHLFDIGNIKISIKAYNNNLLPSVGAGVLYFYTDKFIKKWMPGVVDIIFRPVLALIITVLMTFFLIAPILAIIEKGISDASIWFYEIPYGFGGLILGLIWQPIVFLGMGWPVWLAIDAEYFAGSGVLRGIPIMDGAALAMIGVLLVMAIKAKNKKDASNAYGAIVPLIFGITEPAMYGVTSTKGKPFWLACIGAGISGLLLSMFNITRENIGGYGVLGVLGHTQVKSIVLYLIFAMIGLIVNFAITWVFYSDKPSETHLFNKAVRQTFNFVNNRKDKKVWMKNWENKKDFAEIKSELKSLKNETNLLTKKWIKLNKLKNNLKSLEEKIQTNKNKNTTLINKQSQLNTRINILENELDSKITNLTKQSTKIYKKTLALIKKIDLENYQNQFENIFYNAIFNPEIYMGIRDKKENLVPKKVIFNTENKIKLLLSF